MAWISLDNPLAEKLFCKQTSLTGSALCSGTGNRMLSQKGKPFLLAGPYWPHSSTVKALNTFSACSHSDLLGNSWDLPFPSVKYFSAETCRHQSSVDGCLSGLWEFSMGISQQGTVSPPYRVELFWLLTLNGKASHIREKHVWAQLDFQTAVPWCLDENRWLISEQLRKKVKLIYTTKQNQIFPVPPSCSSSSAVSHKRHLTKEGVYLVDPGPAPNAISPKSEKMEERCRF